MPLVVGGVALFVPSIGRSSSSMDAPRAKCRWILGELNPMDTDNIGRMQHVAQTIAAVRRVKMVGAGMT